MSNLDIGENGSPETTDHEIVLGNVAVYPVGGDLENYLKSLAILNPDVYGQAFALILPAVKTRAAADEWERLTAWLPYLASYDPTQSVPQTVAPKMRRFDPPGLNRSGWARGGGRHLELCSGLLDVPTIQTNISPLVQTNPTTLTRDVDFWLMDQREDYNADAKGRPWEIVEFATLQYGTRASMHITGTWGKTRALSANVWQTVLKYAAYLAWQELMLNISRGLFAWKDLNTEIEYGGGRVTPLAVAAEGWRADFHALAAAEARFVM